MRQQVVGQQHGLRRLQVRLAGHDRGRVCGRLGCERGSHVQRTVADRGDGVAQPHAEEGGHLVIARPTGPQATAQIVTDPVDQATFERAVHVLVGGQGSEAAVGDVGAEAVQTGQQAVALLVSE